MSDLTHQPNATAGDVVGCLVIGSHEEADEWGDRNISHISLQVEDQGR
jgi:hypothetical protein